jgi:hypothetical protein
MHEAFTSLLSVHLHGVLDTQLLAADTPNILRQLSAGLISAIFT